MFWIDNGVGMRISASITCKKVFIFIIYTNQHGQAEEQIEPELQAIQSIMIITSQHS